MKQEDRERIAMSPVMERKMYKTFFGLYGTLPIAYTERVMYNESFDGIDRFFEQFSSIVAAQQERLTKNLSEECRWLLKNRKQEERPGIRFVKVEGYNRIGQARLGRFILGSAIITPCQRKTFGRLGNMKLAGQGRCLSSIAEIEARS